MLTRDFETWVMFKLNHIIDEQILIKTVYLWQTGFSWLTEVNHNLTDTLSKFTNKFPKKFEHSTWLTLASPEPPGAGIPLWTMCCLSTMPTFLVVSPWHKRNSGYYPVHNLVKRRIVICKLITWAQYPSL